MRVFIVEDEPVVAEAIVRLARRVGEPYLARTVAAANEMLAREQTWGAFLFDVGLSDGSGIDLLVRARKAYPTTPALLLGGFVDPRVLKAACELHARYLTKVFFDPKRLVRFLREASNSDAWTPDPVNAWAHAWEARYKLSPSETDVLIKYADGASREEIAELRETSAWSVKSQEESLCQKTGDPSIQEAAARLLREVARGSDGP
jgi:DNA-binding NarL/FixJ family response regulator